MSEEAPAEGSGDAGRPVKSAEALARRARRNQRKAWATGYMQGICTLLRPGDLAVDLGANRGDVTAQLAATGADVVAFEPDPVTFEKLKARFDGVANVTLVHAAAGVGSGTVRLMRADNYEGNPEGASVKSTILDGGRRIDAGNAVEVALVDFPGWIKGQVAARGSIAFVKMDIEGAELDILEAMDAQGLFVNIRGLVAETHERKFKDLRTRYKALKAAIAEHEPSGKINLDWI